MAPAQEFGAAPIRTVRLEWFSQTYYRVFDGRGDPDCAVVVDVIAQGHLDVLQCVQDALLVGLHFTSRSLRSPV